MKNFLTVLAISLLIFSCNKNSDIDQNLVNTATLDGTLLCLNNNPLVGILITITDSNGVTQSSTTDASGHYSFNNLSEVDYTMSFVDPANYTYSQSEYAAIYQDLQDVVLAVRTKTNIDHIAYNLINYDDGLTTYDVLLFNKLSTGDILMSEIDFPWRYIFTSELDSNASITNQLVFTYTQDLDLDISAMFVGDNSGITCQ